MKWGHIGGITIVAILMILYEWPKLGQEQKKEKAALAALTALGYTLAVNLIQFPIMPGPTQLVTMIFKPLFGKILE